VKTVKVIDLETRAISKIPASELTRHYVRAQSKVGGKMDAYVDLRAIKRRLAEHQAELLRKKDYDAYLFSFDGHKRFLYFDRIASQMDNASYWHCLGMVWSMIETSHEHAGIWLAHFKSKRPQREKLMNARERKRLKALPDVLTIYRGCARTKHADGISWTLSRRVAEFFVNYSNSARRALLCQHKQSTTGIIVSGQCYKRDVLAYFSGRKEKEIVIDAANVFEKQIHRIDCTPAFDL